MPRTNRDTARDDLIAFAKWTLDHLARDDDWSADTLDNIASMAMHLKLARMDKNGFFRRVTLPPTV